MKKLGILLSIGSIGLVVSAVACSGTPDAGEGETRASRASSSSPTSSTKKKMVEAVTGVKPGVLEMPDDPYLAILPVGSFADIDALCSKQKEIILPRLIEATQSFKDEGDLQTDGSIEPSCKENVDVLKQARISLEAPFLEATTITMETGYSTDTFLVVRTEEGWTAVRDTMLSDNHRDPGCGSIERPSGIVEVRASKDALIVLTTSDRSWWNEEHESGQLYLTYARACRLGEWGPTCHAAETVGAKIVTQPDEENPKAPSVTREVFATTFTVDDDGAINPTTRFDEERL